MTYTQIAILKHVYRLLDDFCKDEQLSKGLDYNPNLENVNIQNAKEWIDAMLNDIDKDK